MARTTVLYIAGWGRSGSTILGNILGQLPGFFYAGEVSHLWGLAIVENAMCGCGVRFADCPVWGGVLASAFGGVERAPARRMNALKDHAVPKHRDLFMHALTSQVFDGQSNLLKGPEQTEYLGTLGRLYRAIRDTTGCRVIVDSTKTSSYLYMLGQVPDLDVRVVHLVRDPRATTFSWLRRIERTDGGRTFMFERFPVWESAGRWITWNGGVPIVAKLIDAPVQRILYESFVAHPGPLLRQVLSTVSDVCTVPESAWPLTGAYEVNLAPTHTVWGNPSRMRTGRVKIKIDDEWSTELPPWAKAIVVALTYPLARHYGYFAGPEQANQPSTPDPYVAPPAPRERPNVSSNTRRL